MADNSLNTNYCLSRRLLFVYNVPPTRYNPTSPYVDTSYNKNDLDMRRKAEILKYNTSTQQGTITKKKRWGQIVNTSIRSTSSANLSVDCASDDLLPTLTSACDVPGPITVLYKNPAVPLYNYKQNPNAYSILDIIQSTEQYQINGIVPNLLYDTNVQNFLCTLKILDNIESDKTTFEIYVPVTIQINYDLSNSDISGSILTSIDLPNFTAKYGYDDVIIESYGVNMFSSNDIPSINTVIHPSHQYRYTILPNNNTPILIHNYLVISNIGLSTSSGYVYSLYLSYSPPFSQLYTIDSSSNIKNCSISVYLNYDLNPIKMKMDTEIPPYPADSSIL